MFGNRHRVPMTRITALRGVPMFAGLPDDVLARVDANMTELEFGVGAELMRENDFGREAFIVAAGVAEVTIGGHTVGSAGPGDLVGELALLDNGPRTATVTAATPMRVWVLDPREFGTLFDDPRAARWIAATLARRLRAGTPHRAAAPA